MTNHQTQIIYQQISVITQSLTILNSYYHWTGKHLIDTNGTDKEIAARLFHADFPVLSHTNADDPIFNYGNQMALSLWEIDWDELIKLPSRKSAEPIEQAERDRIIKNCQEQGICNYQVVRISTKGQRFFIPDGILWNLLDEHQQLCGQAATFSTWEMLN
ncbi:MEKHLA domain-containing protein [Anabaena sp. FACHB-1237]|uniref:MEKHLA domain-containing protein n=1 Tax=Anabaena sp. FACHB-1237 TaxID=2692769 RepID=UPI0016818081|nr:MEKHLA domain-containing protein [Anabaena sp. FACHB-1237]MBD2138570.1 MEKHLA domain-containing protein [Anabaena sp. FACHB-1237]